MTIWRTLRVPRRGDLVAAEAERDAVHAQLGELGDLARGEGRLRRAAGARVGDLHAAPSWPSRLHVSSVDASSLSDTEFNSASGLGPSLAPQHIRMDDLRDLRRVRAPRSRVGGATGPGERSSPPHPRGDRARALSQLFRKGPVTSKAIGVPGHSPSTNACAFRLISSVSDSR